MKKLVLLTTLTTLVFGLLFLPSQTTFAQVETPTPTLVSPSGSTTLSENEISLSKLEIPDTAMRGPFDSFTATFSVPADWQLSDGAQLVLKIDARFFRGISEITGQTIQGSGATMDVSFNDKILTTLLIDWTGERTVTIPITPEALTPYLTDGRHELFLFLDAAVDCFLDFHETTVVVRSDSKIILPHAQAIPSASLATFPRPLYLSSAFAPTPVKLIVPDSPTAEELQAALTISAGLGRLTTGRIPLTLTTPSLLSNEDRQGAHLIYVGKASSFSDLQGASLPAPSNGSAFTLNGLQPDDGIVQVINSTFNPQRLMYIIGGNSDIGVVKAAQALSSGNIRTTGSTSLAVVADVQQSILAASVAENRTIKDLGYPTLTLSGLGIQSQSYRFYVPVGQVAQDGAYLDLVFNHSALLDYELSGMVLSVNDQTIGGVRFSDQNTAITTTRVAIPPYVIRPGDNFLRIDADMAPSNLCSEFVSNGLWTTLVDTTLLHLPLTAPKPEATQALNLTSYPLPFTSSPTLGTLGIVLPQKDPVAWNTASKLTLNLGSLTFGNLVGLKVMFDNPSEDARGQYDLLVVGKASELPVISELSSSLPAPFDEGSNVATERGFPIVYRLPADASLGYLQWLPAPWNTNRTVMAVLGSTDQGLAWAGDAILKPELRSRIGGDFVVAHETQVLSSNSRLSVGSGLSATLVPAEAVKATQTSPQTTQAPVGTPAWVIPAVLAVTALIVLLLVIVVFSRRSRS
ncbi:MAG: cellulose biosynthesis cyclic di-GMP-binding regulatory protein BcsB [Anaerolineaceae bacterium]|nr:cellulose biosynthesis cyclic di-GMP-binding regulatory protein BcsB [Anaerolineaceae bacterium]